MTTYIYRKLSANNATGLLIKSGTGVRVGWSIQNTANAVRYVKFYNKSTAPSVGTDTPVITLAIPANGAISFSHNEGINFSDGIGIGIVTGVADNDTTAPSANDVVANVFYQ